MKALVFAAGLGTRLKPITDSMPKALVPINGIPLLKQVILKLKTAGVSEIIINIHHKGEQIIDYVQAENNFGIRIEFSDERDCLLDTGGGIKKAADFFDDDQPFFVHNVDILSDVDLNDFYSDFIRSGAMVGLFSSYRKTSRYLLFDQEDSLRAWKNETTGEVKPPGFSGDIQSLTPLAFNGIHILSPCFFRYLNDWTGRFSIIDAYLACADKIKIKAYHPENKRILDVGKIESLQEAEQFLSTL